MCDYSLELYKTREAKQNDVLTLHTFPSSTKGFIAGGHTDCAVCVKEGAILSLDTPQGICHFGVFTSSLATGFAHRDGIISNGQSINLQSLPAGTIATIHVPATDGKEDADVAGPSPAAPEDADLASPATVYDYDYLG